MKKIRPIEEKDITALIKLCKAHAEYEKADYSSTDKAEKLSKALFAPNSNLKCLVAEMDNEVVGYCTFIKQFSTWDAEYYVYLDCLFLLEKTRGKGFGKKLMQQVKEYAITENCSIIQWQTPSFNKNAINFYNKLGAHSKSKERFTWQ